MKKFIVITLIVLVCLVVCFGIAWVLLSPSVSKKVATELDSVLTSCIDTNGTYSEDLRDSISPELYGHLNFRDRDNYPDYGVETTEEYSRTDPTVFYAFFNCFAYYEYTYVLRNKETGAIIGGSWDVEVKVTLNLRSGKWVITDVEEGP